MPWAQWLLVVGLITTTALLALAIVGDRSRGRRRRPKCWYDMSATPGLVCPECGRDAKSESRLFSRRRPVYIAAGVVPLLAGVAVYGAWLGRQPNWVDRVPAIVLIAASPWLDGRDKVMVEALLRRMLSPDDSVRMSEWERWLQGRISLRVARAGGPPLRVLLHAHVAVKLYIQDDSTTEALIGLIGDPDANIVSAVPGLLADMRATDKVERAFVRLSEHPDFTVRALVVYALAGFEGDGPRQHPPEFLFAEAQRTKSDEQDLACLALGSFEPSPRSRAVLLNAVKYDDRVDPSVAECAVVALTTHYPDDPYMRDLLVRLLRDRTYTMCGVITHLIEADRWFTDGAGTMTTSRRALYSDEVRSAMIDAANEAHRSKASFWRGARRLLRNHPCFSADERRQILVDERDLAGDPMPTR